MAQSSTARTPESVKNELLAAKLLQQSAAANTGPYTSGGVTALKALSGLMGGLQERQAEQANAQGQAQSNAVLAAALKAYAANRNGPAPTFGDAAAASAGTSPSLGIPTSSASSRAGNPGPYDPKATEALIRARAPAFGIDPDTAVKVARSEGLNVYHGDGGSSFGPFQLHYGGVAGGGNAVGGLGDTFTKQTGLDARDPSTVPQQVDFALSQASKGGWGPWHGAQRVGLSNFAGIGGTRTASADVPAPNARAVSSDTLPPGVTMDDFLNKVQSGAFGDSTKNPYYQPLPGGIAPGTFGKPGDSTANPFYAPLPNPTVAGSDAATVAARLANPPQGNSSNSPYADPTSSAPPLTIQGGPASPFGAPPSAMTPPSANNQALAAALRQSVTPPAPDPLTNPTPMDQQGGIGGPAPSPQLLASVLKGNGPLQGSTPMMPASAPLPPPGAQSGAQPGNPFGAMPTSMAQAPAQVPTPPAPAPDLSANGLQMAALGGGDPGMAAVLQAGAQAQAAPASGLSSATMPGMDNFGGDGSFTQASTGADGYTGGFGAGIQPAINGDLPAPQALAGGPAPMDPVAPPAAMAAAPMPPAVAPDSTAAVPTPAPSMPIMARASSNPPQVLAQALRASQPATSPADQPAGDPGLPDTGPVPPPGIQSLANADMPAPGASAAGPASVPPGMLAQALRSAQPLGLAGDGGGDPSSARAFLTQQAQGAQPSVLAQALRQQNGMSAPTQPSGGGFDLGSLFGGSGGNPLANIPVLGSLFGGGQQQPSVMPTGTPASAVQQSPQPAPQGSGSGPLSFMGGLGGGLFGGQQQAAPASAVTGQAAIDAALADPRISDSIKMKLMETPEHSYSIAPNGTMYDAKTGRVAGGNFEKPTPQQSVQTPDGRVFSFDPASGSYKEGPSGSPAPTSDMRNYDAYAAQETAAGRTPLSRLGYETALKTAGKTEVNVNTKDEGAEAAARGAARAKRFSDIADDGAKITDDAIKYQRLGDLLNTVNTGPKTAYLEKIRQSTGLTLDPNTDQVQALNAAIQQIVPTLHVAGSGSTSDRDQANFVQSLPTLAGSAGGNQKILDTLNGTLAYRQQRAQIAQAYQDNKINAEQADAQIAALPSPFAPKKDAPGSVAQPQVGAPDTSAPKVSTKDDYDKLPSGTSYVAPDGTMRRKS